MKIELVNEAHCPKCAEVKNFHADKAAKLRSNGGSDNSDGLNGASNEIARKHDKAQDTDKCVDCRKADKKVNESASKKAMHLRKSKKYAMDSRTATNPEAKKRLYDMSKVEAALANQIDENFWNPRNVVSNDQTSGASTDDTVYQDRLKAERPYRPGQMDAMDTEHNQKVTVPAAIIAQLDARSREAKAYSERLNVTQTDDKQFYLDLAQMFDDLNAYLRSGSVYDIKMASVFLTSLMGPMLYEIPTEAVRFITYGGSHAPLKSFMNSVTVPQGGIDMYSDVHKGSKDKK